MASLIKRDGGIYYLQSCIGGQAGRVSTGTTNLQLAKEKQRQFESASLRGDQNALPSRTPIADIVGRYVQHIRTRKTAKSAQKDVYYLRVAFGPICDELKITSRRISEKMKSCWAVTR